MYKLTISFVIIALFRLVLAKPSDMHARDLSYLGSAIFGAPSEHVSTKLAEEWSEKSDLNPEEFGTYAEGDILFPEVTRNGLVTQAARWKNGVIPYEIAGIFPSNDLQIIQKAMNIYHKYTCIKFRQRVGTDSDYISIVNGNSGCWSSVGRITGRQEINLQSPYCTTKVGTPLHELMHAVGFLHEQNRSERDDYVTIAWSNIKGGHDANFKKADQGTTNGYGVTYDYRSVMHYSPNAFSKNGQPTIIPKDSSKNLKMGQRDGFSKGDLIKINSMYGCSNKLPEIASNEVTSAQSNNNGGLLGFLFQIVT